MDEREELSLALTTTTLPRLAAARRQEDCLVTDNLLISVLISSDLVFSFFS